MTKNVWEAIEGLYLKGTAPAYMTAFQAGQAAGVFDKYQVITSLRIANYLAQVLEESGGLHFLREDMNYTAADITRVFGVNHHSAAVTPAEAKNLAHNPKALAERVYGLGNPHMAKMLGNTQPGDGFAFRGGGPLQTTGRAAYKEWGDKIGVDFTSNPDLIVDARYILLPSLFEWEEKGLNALADKNDIKGITHAINGGYNGYAQRVSWYNQVWKVLQDPDAPVAPYQMAQPDDNIIWLQTALNTLGANPVLLVDGKWGPQSEAALRQYQIANKLSVDGIPGDAVKASITSRLTTASAREPAVQPRPPVIPILKRVGGAVAAAAGAGDPIIKKAQELQGMGINNTILTDVIIGGLILGAVLFVVGLLLEKSNASTPVTKTT